MKSECLSSVECQTYKAGRSIVLPTFKVVNGTIWNYTGDILYRSVSEIDTFIPISARDFINELK
jgi:hypothetical protein